MNPARYKKDFDKITEELRSFAYSYLEKYNPSKQQLKVFLLKKYLTKIKGTKSKKEVTSIIEEIVSNFAKNALINKLDGIVCSPKEITIVKKITKNKLIIVTPGIRPINYEDSKDDQKRVMSPKDAIDAGANYLVMGRPITKSSNPLKSLQSINSSLE